MPRARSRRSRISSGSRRSDSAARPCRQSLPFRACGSPRGRRKGRTPRRSSRPKAGLGTTVALVASSRHDGRGTRPLSQGAGAAQVPARGVDRVPACAAHGHAARTVALRCRVHAERTTGASSSRCRGRTDVANVRRGSRAWSAPISSRTRDSSRHAQAGFALEGWIGLPSQSRAQPDRQHLFVNGRMVRDRLLASAARLAYRDVSHGGRHPAWLLYLSLDPLQVDVNAHPQKLELRFRDSRGVHDFLFRTDRAGARRIRSRARRRQAPAVAGKAGRIPDAIAAPGRSRSASRPRVIGSVDPRRPA